MRRTAKALLANASRRSRERSVDVSYRDRYPEDRRRGYAESRYSGGYADDRYDGGYQNGGYAESRFRDRRGREHYDNGRYAPQSRYNEYDYPMYRGDDGMRQIGFRMDDGRQMQGNPYVGDELRGRSERMMGHASGYGGGKLDKRTAEEWARQMQNADGTTGAHWTMENTEQVMKQYNITCDPAEFFAAMNMMYSDYCEVFKKFGVNKLDFYAEMAKAFLDDDDAVKDKIGAYYEYVVKH